MQVAVWLTGSPNGRGWEHAIPVGVAVVLLLGRPRRMLSLGDDTAEALGVSVQAVRRGFSPPLSGPGAIR